MGVGPAKTGDSILNPNGQTTYETWEFIYDPKIELLYQQANILGGGAGGTINSSGLQNMNTSQPNSFGGGAGGTVNGSSGNPVTNTQTNTPASAPNTPATNNPF